MRRRLINTPVVRISTTTDGSMKADDDTEGSWNSALLDSNKVAVYISEKTGSMLE